MTTSSVHAPLKLLLQAILLFQPEGEEAVVLAIIAAQVTKNY
jgi:hypothetical protein